MVDRVDKSFISSNGRTQIRLRIWTPEGDPAATVQIAHGIAEHCERYEGLACFLAEHGIAVFANDHLGHGKSIADPSEKGFFDENDGWMKVVQDMNTVHGLVCEQFPAVPHFLLGHSMGSFLARTYLFTYPRDHDGVILCGTGHLIKPAVRGGKAVASAFAAVSPKGHSRVVDQIAFGSYNKCFEPARTDYDWLTRDPAAVDAYMQDPMCGGASTNRLFADMMHGIGMITDPRNLAKMKKDTPVLFLSGAMDPVGENGAAVRRAFRAFQKAGMTNVEMKLYENCRHELFNELNKEEMYEDVYNWIEKIRSMKTEGQI